MSFSKEELDIVSVDLTIPDCPNCKSSDLVMEKNKLFLAGKLKGKMGPSTKYALGLIAVICKNCGLVRFFNDQK